MNQAPFVEYRRTALLGNSAGEAKVGYYWILSGKVREVLIGTEVPEKENMAVYAAVTGDILDNESREDFWIDPPLAPPEIAVEMDQAAFLDLKNLRKTKKGRVIKQEARDSLELKHEEHPLKRNRAFSSRTQDDELGDSKVASAPASPRHKNSGTKITAKDDTRSNILQIAKIYGLADQLRPPLAMDKRLESAMCAASTALRKVATTQLHAGAENR